MIELYKNLNQEQVDICSLVLTSAGIYHLTRRWKSGWVVWVRSSDADKALAGMTAYFKENPQIEFANIKEKGKKPPFFSGIFSALVLMAFYLAAGDDRLSVHQAFGASAEHIMHGELYRTVTALMLHADAVHLAGNMAALALFGSAVCGIHGIGLGWLMMLITGIFGNIINAVLYQTNHFSVGASTVVFGAIGILSAYQFWKKMNLPGERLKAWLPLGGGLALLAFLGSGGGRVDVMAHLFGFFSGLVLETIYDLWIQREVSPSVQAACLSVTVGIPVISWVWPLWLSGR